MKIWKRRIFIGIYAVICVLIFLGCSSIPNSLYHDDEGGSDSVHIENYKPSPSYQLLLTGVKLLGYKKNYVGDVDAVIKRTQKYNSGLKQLPPKNFYRRFNVSETTINGRPCFLLAPKQNARTDKAVVFFYGGAFLLGIDSYHWNAIERILGELSVPVYVPLYPIYPETDPNIMISFVDKVFDKVYAEYSDAQIIALGDSSGAYLLLSYCHYLTNKNAALFPSRLILISPAQVVGIDDDTLNEMKNIDKKDPVLSIDIVKNLPIIFNLSDDKDDWFNRPLYGDFSRFPPIHVFTSTNDIFYPLIPSFVERVRLQRHEIELYTGIVMMHGWPYLPVAYESKHALDTLFKIISKD